MREPIYEMCVFRGNAQTYNGEVIETKAGNLPKTNVYSLPCKPLCNAFDKLTGGCKIINALDTLEHIKALAVAVSASLKK